MNEPKLVVFTLSNKQHLRFENVYFCLVEFDEFLGYVSSRKMNFCLEQNLTH